MKKNKVKQMFSSRDAGKIMFPKMEFSSNAEVMSDIRSRIKKRMSEEEFNKRFQLQKYTDKAGFKRNEYIMDEESFILLILTYNRPGDMEWKYDFLKDLKLLT